MAVVLSLTRAARAEDPTQPTIQSMIGGVLFDSELSYVAETTVTVPLLREEPFSFYYRHYEFTPVRSEGIQTQLLYSRHDMEGSYDVGEHLRLIAVGGYRSSLFQDRPGELSAYAMGLGVGSPIRSEIPWLEWSATVGGFLSRDHLDADWWADLHVAWKVFEFSEMEMKETGMKPSVKLALDVDAANEGGRFNALYKAGPMLDMESGNGNRVLLQARYYGNDGNPFLETSQSGLLLGVEVRSSFEPGVVLDARDHRPAGWLPLVWGGYDVGFGGDRTTQKTELFVELHDAEWMGHLVTGVLWYESRQEYRRGDFDNVSYSISIGGQARLGLASMLSQGQPLVLGVEYLHRSAHSLAPDPDRVPPPTVLEHNSINLGPRVRLQTLGWDLPYRDPSIYKEKCAWLNHFDWRLTMGHGFSHSRDRANPAGQVGLNWDAASLHGAVLYTRGLLSMGNETPDWQVEAGARWTRMKVFFRYDDYGLEHDLAEGNAAVVGMGLNL